MGRAEFKEGPRGQPTVAVGGCAILHHSAQSAASHAATDRAPAGPGTMIEAQKGTRDILPGEIGRWQFVEDRARATFGRCGFHEIRTPIFESTELFTRGIGEGSDIVAKEMYTFPDRKGRSLTLRPENTAPVARAYIQHGMHRG